MRVLVCGGREYGCIPKGCPRERRREFCIIAEREQFILRETLDCLLRDRGITALIHGAASGADALAGAWAIMHHIETVPFKADWKGLRKAAGPIRNQRMIDEGKPDFVVAFPGGDGTADMVRKARAAGIEVMEVGE